MFGQIAARYDLLNRVLSLGIDRSWRRKTVRLVPPVGNDPILDVCTGTADLALAYWRASRGRIPIVGVDFCQPMLTVAHKKCRRVVGQVFHLPYPTNTVGQVFNLPYPTNPVGQVFNLPYHTTPVEQICNPPYPANSVGQVFYPPYPTNPVGQVYNLPSTRPEITLLEADALHLPFPDNMFQIVCAAFGLRNLADTDAGLREMVRVCRPEGRVAVLEFSTPGVRPIGRLYNWYFHRILPRIGQALARNTQSAYNYLPQSVGCFPQGEELADRMRAAGLKNVWYKPFTFGVATLYAGEK